VDYKPTSRIKRFTKSVDLVYKKALEVDADLYHLHDPELLRIALKLKRKGKKVIYDAHEDLPRQVLSKRYINPFVRKLISNIIERYENSIVKKLDGVVAATPFIRDRFLKLNKNTVDINNFPILKELLIEYPYEEKRNKEICYVGGITTVRGINELVKALGGTECNLLLAGEFLEHNLKETVVKSENWDKIEELGFLDRDGVKKVYERAKLGIVTLHPISNYIVSLPVKMFEYMAGGIPVVASNFPLWEEIITKNDAGICVDPLNTDAISNAINYLIDNPDKAKKMGENGKRMVIEKYNWNQEKLKLIKLYNDLFSK